MRRLAVIVVVLLGVASSSGHARAEMPPFDAGCKSAAPMTTASLPANIPGLAFCGAYAPSLTDASLLAADGTTVPTKLLPDGDFMLLALSSALVPGETYTLRWSDDCAVSKTKTFVAGEILPLPTAAGTVRVTELRPPSPDATCLYGKPTWPAQRDAIFDEDPALVPFLPVTKVELLIDDKPDPYSYKIYGQYTEADPRVGLLHQSCPAPTRKLRVAVRVRLANGPTLTTPEIETELRCLDTLPGGCPPEILPDSGAPDTSWPAIDATPPDSAPSDVALESPPADAGAEGTSEPANEVVVGCTGCRTPPAGRDDGGAGLVLLALLALRLRAGGADGSSRENPCNSRLAAHYGPGQPDDARVG